MAPDADSKTTPKAAEGNPEAKDTSAGQLTTPKKAEPSAKASPSSTPAKSSPAAESSSREEGEASSSPEPEESSKAAAAPPLPNEPLPGQEDDGWEPVWDNTNQAWYFYNRFTQKSQWTNPRVPEATAAAATAPGVPASEPAPEPSAAATLSAAGSIAGGYNPAIHGDYDPNAWYAQAARSAEQAAEAAEVQAATGEQYEGGAFFNRNTGAWQQPGAADGSGGGSSAERHTDEARARRQMNAFFDVDAAANMHDGRSLKAERSGKKPSKSELKAFKEKRRAKKEEKRRAWLRD